jgi:hypothetical protein
MIQENNSDQLETCLFKQLIRQEFSEDVEVPSCKWRPIWEPTIQEIGPLIDTLAKDGIIERNEARLRLGFPEESPNQDNEQAKSR